MPYEILELVKYAATSKEDRDEQRPTSYHLPTINLATSSVGQVVNAAVIVDPSMKKVIASACDQVISSASLANEVIKDGSCSNYLEHLKASNLENQQTSFLDSSIGEFKHILTNNIACVHSWQWALQSAGCWHPLWYAAVVAIEYSAARDLQLFANYKALSPLSRHKIKESDF